jgi:hypothetical protein
MREFLDVVHQAEELPLRIDLHLSSQRETIEPLVVADIAEDRFHRGEAATVTRSTGGCVDAFLHSVGV